MGGEGVDGGVRLVDSPDQQHVGHARVAGGRLEGGEGRVDVEPVVGIAPADADDREGRRPRCGAEGQPVSPGEGARAGRKRSRRS